MSDSASEDDEQQPDQGQTAAVFFRWRQARLKAAFKQQLTDLLADVSAEERSAKRLKQENKKAKAREAELLQQLSDLRSELAVTIAQRDQRVAQLALELLASKQAASDTQHQAAHMEGMLRSTGERAAAAEDSTRTQGELMVHLQQQLAQLKDRYHQELLDSQQLRAAAAEAAALRSRLEETSAASAGLATACEELRRALDSSTAGLAAAKERVRRLEAAEGLTQALAAVAGPDRGEPGDLGSDLVGALAQQLEEAQAALAVVAPQAAAAEVHVKQQQRHAQQLAGELQEARAAQKAAEERGEVLQVLNVQLQSEVKRMAALAGVAAQEWVQHTDQTVNTEPWQDGCQLETGPSIPAQYALLLSTADLVPAQLFEATRAGQEEAAAHVAELQQQLTQQAAAQQVAAEAYVERVQATHVQMLLRLAWCRWRLEAAAGRAQQLWDALQAGQEALQHSNQLHELRTAALKALLKRQSRMALQPEAHALQWAVLAAWQRQTARQVGVAGQQQLR
ncbi:hypothetical protein OEZ85_014059 [Tetradesmus obliquus]|uniref:Dynein regulatory complex protein 1/2 N-terminal domain-containing protein n=1 Tax=Tetradesmus obliquus TaxID=3088 RepID=A0ABY8UAS3_TETOB|nr:hypothetical protein OEZ85_014059 [Tetradesmus obliquus]